MMSLKILIVVLTTVLCEVTSKTVDKEYIYPLYQDEDAFEHHAPSSVKGKDSSKMLKQHIPLIEGRPIYIPDVDSTKKDSSGNIGKVKFEKSQTDLEDSKNFGTFLKSDSGDFLKEPDFEEDEVFAIDKRNLNVKSNLTKSKNPNKAVIKSKDTQQECSDKFKDDYSKVCILGVNNNKGNKVIEKPKTYPNKNKKVKKTHKKSVSNKSLDIIPPVYDESLPVIPKLKSNLRKQSSERNDAGIFETNILDEHHSLQDEVESMFGPTFKSFVFNPLAPAQAKFQDCKTAKNESGSCRYVQHCFLPSFLSSVQQFMNNVCIIDGSFIGVCCPEFPVSKVSVKWQEGLENIEGLNDTVEYPQECGIGSNTRIVGGFEAASKAWPWMVALLDNRKKFFCGGSLINNRYVLTAAHCTLGSRSNQLIARLGEFDLSTDQGVHEDYRVVEIKRHGQYNRMTLRNDIAVLKLEKPVVFNEFVKTICLPPQNKDYTNRTATLTGWGHVQGGISPFTSDVLQEANFPVTTNRDCADTHELPIPPSLICTAAPKKDKGACNGDSGGPLMLLDDENRWKVIGIVSWGRRGCNTKYPSVFTRVTHYLNWIKEHAN